MIELKVVTPELTHQLVRDLRDADRVELAALGKHDILSAIQDSAALSEENWALVCEGTLLCIMGCASVAGMGIPWMLSTKHLKPFAKGAIPLGIAYVTKWLDQYGSLLNYVHAPNKSAIRWLKWMGFQFDLPPQVLPSGETFLPFRKEKQPSV